MAREAWRRGERDVAQRIVAANPNVGIQASGPGAIYMAQQVDFDENADGSFTFWGANAARALGLVTARNTVERPRAPGNVHGASQGEYARFEEAYDDATARLRDKNCAKAFGGYKKAFAALRETIWRFDDFDRGERNPLGGWSVGAGAVTNGLTVTLNQYGAFMNINGQLSAPFMRPGFATHTNVLALHVGGNSYAFPELKQLQMASFIILHELGHRAGVFVVDGVSGPAGAGLSIEPQGKNNAKIFEACGFNK
jgi:hypothetical protein